MNKTAIDRFCRMASLELPDLIDAEHLESADDYDDYVLLTFSLESPMSMDEVLDCLDDQSELNILYHVGGIGVTPSAQHCCAYASPEYDNMYKVNAQSDGTGAVDTLYVHVYSSLEVMLESLKDDLRIHEEIGEARCMMPLSRLIADFM